MNKRICILRRGTYPGDLLLRREAETLRDGGFMVTVLCCLGSDQNRTEVVDGVTVHRLPITSRKSGLVSYLLEYLGFTLLAAAKLTWLYFRGPFALIQVNTMPDWLVFATLIPRLLGAKVSLQIYEPMPELWFTLFQAKSVFWLLGIIQRACICYAHGVFTVTEQLKETMVRRGAKAEKITVLLNAPDERFLHVRLRGTETRRPHGKRFVLICHGAIEERYGIDTMFHAVALLRHEIPWIELRILGKGSYLDAILDLRKALNLQEQVQYLGYVPLAQLANELYEADAGIVAQKASLYSHLVHTGKMYDYLQFGKPVIASRLGAVNEYFDDTALSFFEPGDPQDLARAIREIVQDDARRRQLVENSQHLYSRYCWERQRSAYLAVSHRLIGLELDRTELESLPGVASQSDHQEIADVL